ncbi:hypothetical protein E2A64_10970 [Pseudohoeflea suaedae]|uniref:Uncharacterized protein n=1 Tax=Pseudohoeflea suaedae TaxID=877384 RepID=A0A4R5PKK7_9HYPH|nr:hypothetical protein [Pseudohoeflea suaedae]TDH35838.1 hypothetical protein E2A64_10970 [Pseudohoeflea suaedae]
MQTAGLPAVRSIAIKPLFSKDFLKSRRSFASENIAANLIPGRNPSTFDARENRQKRLDFHI